MNRSIILPIIHFILYIGIQVIALRNFALFDFAFCYVYISFILFLPLFEINIILFIFLGFLTGAITDLFYNTIGIHAAASTLVAYLRLKVVNSLTPIGGYPATVTPTLKNMGARWFLRFTFILVFIHQFTLFYLEAGIHSFFFTLAKVISSVLFTFVMIILIQLLFYSSSKRTA